MNTKPLGRKSGIEYRGYSIDKNHTVSVLYCTSKINIILSRTGKSELTKSLIRPVFSPVTYLEEDVLICYQYATLPGMLDNKY